MTAGITVQGGFDAEENSFSRIILDKKLTREEKVANVAKELTFSGDYELDQQRLRELNLFSAYLQAKYENLDESLKTINFELLIKARNFLDETKALGEAKLAQWGIDPGIKQNEDRQRMAQLTCGGDNLLDGGRGMQYVYSILNDACQSAFRQNLDARATFASSTDAIDGYIIGLDDCRKSLAEGCAHVVEQSSRILTAKYGATVDNLKSSLQASSAAQAASKPVSFELPQEVQDAIASLNDTSAEKNKPARARPAARTRINL